MEEHNLPSTAKALLELLYHSNSIHFCPQITVSSYYYEVAARWM